jgi:predicted dehydrogenase
VNKPVIRIGVVGFGYMGQLHTANWRNLSLIYSELPVDIRLVGVVTGRPESLASAVQRGGFVFGTTDYRRLIASPEIDLIDICTPNDLHFPIFMEALAAGKHIYCEKPLALNLAQASEMRAAARRSDRIIQLAFNYRFIPAITRARQLVDGGFLGNVLTFRINYLHASYLDPERKISWRLQHASSGGGALVDLGSHAIDMIAYLLGDFRRVFARTQTFIGERPAAEAGMETRRVDVDDHAQLIVELRQAGTGTIEASRIAAGSANDLSFHIHGTGGAIAFDLMRPNWLSVYNQTLSNEPLGGRRGYTDIQTMNRYANSTLPGSLTTVGTDRMHAASQYRILEAIAGLRPPEPSVEDGYRVQEVIEAAYRSAQAEKWVDLPLI